MSEQETTVPNKPTLIPRDPNFDQRVRKSFGLQTVMKTIGIELVDVAPGSVTLSMPYTEAYTQQHGFIHAGITATALDSACAYAAFSLMDSDAAVLTVEFKTNLIAPAKGNTFIYQGTVLKPGRTLSVSEGKAFARGDDGKETLVASMTATIMAIYDRKGLSL